MPRFHASQLHKCYDRLSKAKEALFQCRKAEYLDDLQSHFASFLIHTGSILNALEAGARKTPQARQWYGERKREGRADPLVTYMHQARNAEEHGVSPIMTRSPTLGFGVRDDESGEIDFNFGTDWGSGEVSEDGSHKFKKDPNYKPNPKGKFIIGPSGPGYSLTPVYDDRFKQTFWLPYEHKGRRISTSDPIRLAELYLAYIEDLIREAEPLAY